MKRPWHKGWNLYWVSSDGEEDCFVIARNARSAARVDADYCGFDAADLSVTRVRAIPSQVAMAWKRRRIREKKGRVGWPWYADRWLLQKLSAHFRERDGVAETLIDEVVYSQGGDGPAPPRPIGRKYLEEFRAEKKFTSYGHEDTYSPSQMTLFSLLGICIARCQEIEHLIAHSFVLGAMAPSERRREQTIGELIKSWKRKTLGQMLRIIDEGYEIEPTVRASFELFLKMRNRLVHGLTTDDQYDIRSSWGQDEMIAFLTLFELVSRPVREMFRSSFYASIEIGNTTLLANEPEKQISLSKREKKQVWRFVHFFKVRQ